MTLNDKVLVISQSLKTPNNYEGIFGDLPKTNKAAQKVALNESFRRLALSIHPDLLVALPKPERQFAEDTFKKLVEASKNAQRALENGFYSSPPSDKTPDSTASQFTLSSRLSSYTLNNRPRATGASSKLYSGTSRAGLDVLVKIASNSTNNQSLEREIQFLEKVHSKSDTPEIARFIPEVLDTFIINNASKRLRATVFEGHKNLVSVSELIDAYPNGMPAIDAAWVCRRLLGQVCAATMFGVVHCALVPDHLMVGVETHDPIHIGWSHAIGIGERKINNEERWKAYYPPELLRKSELDSRSDIYMAGKTMIALLGGDLESNALPATVPGAIAKVIHRCVQFSRSKRYVDGPDALDAFSQAAWSLWGKKYRRLQWPPQQ
ncbi:MAG: hypothetical protein P1V97_36010 [Planctomycetota bacterium]|nr:hypothetical protein [Planctomycetota bacterium]